MHGPQGGKVMRRLLSLLQDAIEYFRSPLDFGEFGVLVRDGDGNLVPMDQDDMYDLKTEVEKSEADFWSKKQAEAFATHGSAILKLQ